MIELPTPPQLLIAPPNMPDIRFRKTVLMLSHNNDTGSFALCMNRPTGQTLEDIGRQLEIDISARYPIYWGGPVNPGVVWMLHSSEWRMEQTVDISEEWAMTSDINMFSHLSDGDTPNYFRLTFGMCTWAFGQLEAELKGIPPYTKGSSWLIADNPGPEFMIEHAVEHLWEASTNLCSKQAVDSWLS